MDVDSIAEKRHSDSPSGVGWVAMIAVALYSVWATLHSGITAHGKVLAILMYVLSYIESVIVMSLFYQQAVRLREIAIRLKG